MEESRNIGGIGRQCPDRAYPFGGVVSPEVVFFRSSS
jgi:hypothetical protein